MRRKILLFAAAFLPCLVVSVWLYSRVLPAYQQVVTSGIDVVLHRFDPPLRIEVTDDGGWHTFVLLENGEEDHYWYRPGKNLTTTLMGLALLPPLLLATPVGLRRRLVMVVAGVAILAVAHMVAGTLLVWSIRCLANSPGTSTCVWVKTVANTFGQLASVAIWGLLTWDVWIPDSITPRSS